MISKGKMSAAGENFDISGSQTRILKVKWAPQAKILIFLGSQMGISKGKLSAAGENIGSISKKISAPPKFGFSKTQINKRPPLDGLDFPKNKRPPKIQIVQISEK